MTSTLVFEGNGRVQEFVGGYIDWVRQSVAEARGRKPQPEARGQKLQARGPTPEARGPKLEARKKLSYKEQRELDGLPARIDALEAEQNALNAMVRGPDFYKESREAIAETLARGEELQREFTAAYARWTELDARAKR